MKVFLLALVIGLSSSASCLFSQSAGDLFSRYAKAEQAGDWPAAEKIARQGIAKYPDEIGFYNCLSYALRRRKKPAEALAVIEPIHRKNPQDANLRDNFVSALIDRGWECNEKKEYQRALEYFTQARAVLPAGEWVINAYGYILIQLNRKEEGIAELEKGLADFPSNDSIKSNLVFGLLSAGWDYYNAKDLSRALALFTKALALAPADEWALNARGVGLRDGGALDEGIGILEKGLKRYPANTFLKGNLSWAYILKANKRKEEMERRGSKEKADWTEAETWYQKAGALNRDDENYLLNYGGFLNTAGRYDEAIALLEKGAKLFPADKYFLINLQYSFQEKGRALAARRDYAAAAAVMQTARTRFPNEACFLVDLADAWFEKRDYPRSAAALAELAEMKRPEEYGQPFPADRREIVYFRLMRLVWKFAEIRDHQAGFSLVDRLAAAFPDAFFVPEARGVLAFQSGDKARGIALVNEAFDRYIALHPGANFEMTLDLPLQGAYRVGGNNRTDAVTHAGLNRFCYDFMGANDRGEILKPGVAFPGKTNTDYYGFGADIYCPVDGTVEDVVDLADDLTPRAQSTPADGNSVSIRDEAGFHYFFAHNKKGSAAVTKGQRVKKGDKLAAVGNNGYSAQPHLHFGVYTPDWRVSVRVKFKSYVLLTNGKETLVTDGIPQTNDVIKK